MDELGEPFPKDDGTQISQVIGVAMLLKPIELQGFDIFNVSCCYLIPPPIHSVRSFETPFLLVKKQHISPPQL